jgi:hypothetical protein
MRIRVNFWLCLIGSVLLIALSSRMQAAEIPEFTHITLDENIGKVCYAVTVADVNNDGKPDAVALSENRLIWYENPTWKPHVILENQLDLDHVCLEPFDIDGDGLIDFAVGAGWTKKGTIQWISRDKENPDGLWKVYPIAEEPWTHRMRWGDVLGTGKPQLTVSPLNKTEGDGVRLLAFEIPENPRTDRWQATVMSDSLNKMHNHWIVTRNPELPPITFTASEEGISMLSKFDEFKRKSMSDFLTSGQVNPMGAGEIKVSSATGPMSMIATVEPFHGNELAVYVKFATAGSKTDARRYLLTDQMKRGHALWLADLNNDGQDEIIIGHSDPGEGDFAKPSISIFGLRIDGENVTWTRTILDDEEMASEDLIAHDFNGDGWIDILAGGRNTHNVKLYLNQGLKTADSDAANR